MRRTTRAGVSGSGARAMVLTGSPIFGSQAIKVAIALALTALLALQFGGLLERGAGAQPINLVENGSFEQPSVGGQPNLGLFFAEQVPGWNLSPGSIGQLIEIQNNWTGVGAAAHGNQLVELDAVEAISIYQEIDTVPGTVYRLRYAFAARPDLIPEANLSSRLEDNRMNVNWGAAGEAGALIRFVEEEPGTVPLTPGDWTYYTDFVIAETALSRLEFAYAGESTGVGALLDDVSLVPALCTSVQSGPWGDPSTWSCDDIPNAHYDVVVGHTVTLDGDHEVNNITIDGTLDNTGGHVLEVHGDWILNGDYLIDDQGHDEVHFKGHKDQKIDGDKESSFSNLKVIKEKKTETDPEPELDVEKKVLVKKKLTLEHGKTRLGDAELHDVEIKEDAKLEGKDGTTKAYTGDKTVNGEYDPKQSKDEFVGPFDQKISGDSAKQQKLEYHELLIKKGFKPLPSEGGVPEKSTAEFEKDLKVAQKTQIEQGKAKVHQAEFDGDVQIDAEGELEGTPEKTKTYLGDKTVDGKYIHNQSIDEFAGSKVDQKISGSTVEQQKLEYYELYINKLEKEQEAEFQKELLVKQKTEIQKGTAKTHDAEFEGDVEIKQDAKLSGSNDSTQTFYKDKTVDGEFEHNQSKTEFKGDEDQTIDGGTEKQEKLEYYELLILKEQEKQASFEKDLKVEQKTTVEEGNLKTKNAEFEGDVEIKEHAKLEGTQDTTKTYKGDKTVDGDYEHEKSKDEFIGDKDQKVTSEDETKKQEAIEYYDLLIKKQIKQEEQEQSEVEFEKSLKVEQKTTIEEGILKTNTVFNEVVIDQDGVLILGEDDDPTEVHGDWTNDGEFHSGNGTVIFNGDEPQSIDGQSTSEFNNLTIDNETTINSSVKVEGTLKLTAVLTIADGGALELADGAQIETEGEGGITSTQPVAVGPITGAPEAPIPVGTEITVHASFTNPGLTDSHEAVWLWDKDGSQQSAGVVEFETGEGVVTGTNTYNEPGVYTVTLTVTPNDNEDRSGTAEHQFVVVYDPEGGFVTGGGWIDSPAGAYTPDPDLTGKANFGFVARYQRGANVPTGNTQFEFKAGALEFKSTEYEWLVIAGAGARFKGSGTINGTGDYGFMLVGIDGSVNGSGGDNKFRISIWDKSDDDTVVYDNQHGAAEDSNDATVLGGGNIQVHQPQGGGNNGGGRGNN